MAATAVDSTTTDLLRYRSIVPKIVKVRQSANTSISRDSTALEIEAPAVVDPRLPPLFAASEDEVTELMAAMQQALREGDSPLATALRDASLSTERDVDDRILALHVLAGARAFAFDEMVLGVIKTLSKRRDERLQRGAIAAATHLSRSHKLELRTIAQALAGSPSSAVRRAAEAFSMTLQSPARP